MEKMAVHMCKSFFGSIEKNARGLLAAKWIQLKIIILSSHATLRKTVSHLCFL